MKKAQYKTRQLLEIEDFLKNNENKHVTVNDIILFFKQQGKNIDVHPVCFHCKCEKCGKLIHLECTELSLIGEHLREEHGFSIDHARTVFYGTCNECRE